MPRPTATLLAAILLTACAGPMPSATSPGAGPETPEPANGAVTLYHGGPIYTGQAGAPRAEAVIVDEAGTIVAVQTGTDTLEADWPSARRIDLRGAALYPGFVDAHAHLRGIGERELTLDLSGADSLARLLARVELEAGTVPAGGVLFGRGWIETGWPEGRMPTAADLDTVSADRRIVLVRADGHALVANSAALEAAGITADTPDPDGGAIERTSTGAPSGILIDNAMAPVLALVERRGEAAVKEALAIGAEVYAARGWTAVHNMSVSGEEARLLAELDAEGRLPLRVYNALNPEAFDIAASRAHESPRVTNRAVKLYMDGALGSRGALLSAPYADRPGTTGLSLLKPGALSDMFDRADTAGVQLAIHAIGDLANRRVIAAAEAREASAARHRIEHTQILDPADIARLAPAGLIASMQPSHAIGDLFFAPARLGMDRLAGAYAWQSLIDAGTIIAAGSDAPVEVGLPAIEFYAATVRRGIDGTSGEGWHPEEAVSRETALKMLTAWPAHASFSEELRGTIAPGKQADFSAFDLDLMTVPDGELLDAGAVLTVVGGEIVFNELERIPAGD